MSGRKRESGDVACVVVAVGEQAFRALKAIPRTGFWGLVAVGEGAALADADRTLAPRDGEERDDWHARAIRCLEEEWHEAGFVYVVHDERSLALRPLAAKIILAGHRPERVAASVLLGDSHGPFVGPRGDLGLRLSRGASATETGRADALRIILGPFESCWMPEPLEFVAATMRGLDDALVFATRTREATSAGQALATILDGTTGAPASFVHMTLAPDVPGGFGELTAALERQREWPPALTASTDDTFPDGEILVGTVTAARRDGFV
jgi:hypothetical protein